MRCLAAVFLVPALAVVSIPASALEKQSMRVPDFDREGWNASATTTLRYYNTCTGWMWFWTGWRGGEQVGVRFDIGAEGGLLSSTSILYPPGLGGAFCGYGFTGTISILEAPGCGPPLALQPYCPITHSSWAWLTWEWAGLSVPSSFVLSITFGTPRNFTDSRPLISDHPAAGPTGPQACGVCFPTSRAAHSRYYGQDGAYCPSGVGLNDGVCDAEFLVEASVQRTVSVREESWGGIKALYR
jgi:hypothetical protein